MRANPVDVAVVDLLVQQHLLGLLQPHPPESPNEANRRRKGGSEGPLNRNRLPRKNRSKIEASGHPQPPEVLAGGRSKAMPRAWGAFGGGDWNPGGEGNQPGDPAVIGKRGGARRHECGGRRRRHGPSAAASSERRRARTGRSREEQALDGRGWRFAAPPGQESGEMRKK